MKDRINKVDLEVVGREITSISTPRPGLDLQANPTVENNSILGYKFIVDTLSLRDIRDSSLIADIYSNNVRNEFGNRLHMSHIFVPAKIRSRGVGSILFNAFKQYTLKANIPKISIRVGNGDTKDFLISKGVNEDFLFTHQFPGAHGKSTVLTTDKGMEDISNLVGINQTSEQIEGVFIEDAFGDI